ncbi:hypothetical protein HY449_03855 [Candidatus Pacearchaeota archaeon]|nr:hypothetical protein [Candidatus Pacearchaeota archaeon]
MAGYSEERPSAIRSLQLEYFGFLEGINWRKIIFVIFLVALIAVFVFFKTNRETIPYEEKTISCGDGSLNESCSLNKPYYCSGEGILYSNASVCGCPAGMKKDRDVCISDYMNNPREINLKYFINGNESEINFTAYNGLVNYLSSLSEQISYRNDEIPSRRDFKLRDISEKNQRELLMPLVVEIRNAAKTDLDQLRIATSIVQNIEWGNSNKTGRYQRFGVGYSRYPYEVVYDSMGVCGEKSELLAFLLKEMGYGVAIFYNAEENHESVGIKCPLEKSWHETGYCFIETSGPAIISDSTIEYAGGIKINSKPETMILSEGKSLPENMQEYEDAEFMMKMRSDLNNGGRIINPFRVWKYNEIRKKYNIGGSYEIG